MDRLITYAEALHEATEQEMARDDSVIVLGQGVRDESGIYGTTRGLVQRFGGQRVMDTPLSEDAMTGVAVGAALAGMRPIHVHIRMDFVLLAMNQLVNVAAKTHYMYGGAVRLPMVVRVVIGRSWGQGAQHSQGLHAFFMHVPGFKVLAPSTPYDAKACLVTAIRDDNPTMLVEHRMLHTRRGPVPAAPYAAPPPGARVLAPGTDITLVGISYAAVECLRARVLLETVGIDAEVIDPVSLSPLDLGTIAASVRRTRRLLVVDVGWQTCGAAGELALAVTETMNGDVDLRVRRSGFPQTPTPTAKPLQDAFYPTPASIARDAYQLVKNAPPPEFEDLPASEVTEFRGPF